MGYTRLIVKNLPNSATETKLKELFGSKGTVTDVQLKKNDDGKFRHFAFVGFKTEEEAERAKEYFHKTFVGAAKIDVDYCRPLNDPSRPKPWSKQGKQKFEEEFNARKKARAEEPKEEEEDDDDNEDGPPNPKKIKKRELEILEKAKSDPELFEFLNLHGNKKNKWQNDTFLDEFEKLLQKREEEKKAAGKAKEVVDSDSEHEDEKKVEVTKKKPVVEDTYFTVKLKDLPKKTRKKDIKGFFAPLVPKSIRMPPNVRGFAYVGFKTEQERKKALSKNNSMLLGNQISVKTYTSRQTVEAAKEKTSRWKHQTEELKQETESVSESGRIFVRNLAYTATEDELKAEFEQFGPITEVHLPVDRLTRQSKGFAFVTFMLPEHAAKAFQALDGSVFQGRMLHLLPSKGKDELEADDMHAGSSYKREKQLKLKKSASSSHNWNTLFLGANAVSAVASEKYGVSREELLLDQNETQEDKVSSVAVRMALAETEIVAETKKFLETNGVCLDAFEVQGERAKIERSSTTMLVKNLTPGTTETELRELFQKHGVVGRVVMPPHGITAVVEYVVPAEARGAFKKLAYSKFKSLPLYLEYAPVNVFRYASDGSKIQVKKSEDGKETESTFAESGSTRKQKDTEEIELPNYEKDHEPIDENMVPEPETCLFVKNLDFGSTEDDLKKHFSHVGKISAATVAKKKDPKNPGQMLSQGFGFIQFYLAKDAAKALKTMNGSVLQNHTLEVKMSSRTLQSESNASKNNEEKSKGTKILVRNVPFQASEEEITDLFKVFGKLKAVRMPRKSVGENQHRGFAFIDFFTEANAKAAFDTLSKSTHIYGRRLNLEWAQKDSTVEELREKVAKAYDLQSSSTSSGNESTKKKLKRYFDSKDKKASQEADDADE